MSISGLEKLDAWCKARDFAVRINKEVLPLLPPEEKWSLNQQLRRSSQSVPANIAEGYGRFYYQDNVRFCYNARGSLEEVLSHLTFAYDMNLISEGLYKELANEGEEIDKMLNGYISYLKKSKHGASEPGANYLSREESASYSIESGENLTNVEDSVL